MSWWQKFLKNPYKWGLWKWIGGRPWTYILRDIWHKFEFIWIVGLIAIGVSLGHHYNWITVLKVLFVFAVGYIGGHLFWGKDYKPNEKGD